MASISRQQSLLAAEDWKKVYQTFRQADFQSFDFETLRKSMIDYLKINYPEDFNDFIDSSEYIALIDMIAFLGQSIAFRADLNARENFIDTAERRDSILKLAKLISYSPKRNLPATGYLKINSISTTENVNDSAGTDLANRVVNWADLNNVDWQEQFNAILNAAMMSTQRVGKPAAQTTSGSTKYQQYQLNLPVTTQPIYPFEAKVNGTNTRFEITGTTIDNGILRETYPSTTAVFDLLYKNDGQGTQSAGTGFFMRFTQGRLQSQVLSILDSISNRTISYNVDNINNNDVWLFDLNSDNTANTLWKIVPAVATGNIVYNTTANFTKKIYQVTSRNNDQIDLTFGDGNFAQIPVGAFRLYYRTSNATTYRILPTDMSRVPVSINYISRKNRVETLTIVLSLPTAVTNASARETLNDIRQRAPQQYYTQNRMVNGEDYNIFPYTAYSSIVKSKAVNRTSSGISRFLDVIDVTGKHSTTNIFGDDGILYSDETIESFTFEYQDVADIVNLIDTKIQSLLGVNSTVQFYYAHYPRYSSSFLWHQSTLSTNQCTGYFTKEFNNVTTVAPIGYYSSSDANGKYLRNGTIVKFAAPSGYYFDLDNNLVAGTPDDNMSKDYIYATLITVVDDGTNSGAGNAADGSGPVSLNDYVPSGAVISEIIPSWEKYFTSAVISQISTNIQNHREFGLSYDNASGTWTVVNGALTSDIFAVTVPRQSWVIRFSSNSNVYTVSYRALKYIFESERQTRFYYDNKLKIFDSKTGQLIVDQVRILESNTKPGSSYPLAVDYVCYIYDQITANDGYVDNSRILVTFSDKDNDGIADNPDFFTNLVYTKTAGKLQVPASGVPNYYYSSLVFFKRSTDQYQYEVWTPVTRASVNTKYSTLAEIQNNQIKYLAGQLFYATADHVVYRLNSSRLLDNVMSSANIIDTYHSRAAIVAAISQYSVGQLFTVMSTVDGAVVHTYYRLILNTSNAKDLLVIPESETNQIYQIRTGRQNLFFQYRHNSPDYRRIDPSPVNIIDLYILTKQYDADYRLWAQDPTGTVVKPTMPTAEELENDYVGLNEYKMVSDTVIFNSAKFKPLFGVSAEPNLQAMFKVVKIEGGLSSDSEVKTALISAINDYFTVDNWDFGETFYFSELAAYLHQRLVSMVGSIVIVPAMTQLGYGVLQQINSEANEILISTATVDNVKIIPAITAVQINSRYIV